jgi:hypothetical protein
MKYYKLKENALKLIVLVFIIKSNQFALSAHAASLPRFSNYPVKEIYHGQIRSPDFSKDEYTQFRVQEQVDDMKKGPNFAGHYTIMSGGCGTSCIFYIVVDHIT